MRLVIFLGFCYLWVMYLFSRVLFAVFSLLSVSTCQGARRAPVRQDQDETVRRLNEVRRFRKTDDERALNTWEKSAEANRMEQIQTRGQIRQMLQQRAPEAYQKR